MAGSLQTHGDHIAFINSIQLTEAKYSLPHSFQNRLKLLDPPDNEREGFIVGGSLAAFTQNVSGRIKQNILDVTLFAQLASDKKFDRENQAREWYTYYTHILGNVGFIIQDFQFQKYESSGMSLNVDAVVIDLFEEVAEGGESAVVGATLNAMRQMSDDDRRIELFKAHSSRNRLGNFQVVSCDQAPNGEVSITLGAFEFTGSETEHGFLFLSWSTATTDIFKGSQKCVVDTDVYERVRSTISNRIGHNAAQLVASINI